MQDSDYPPIGDYGFIADCHSAALVSKRGSIDWCSMPRLDSASIFGRILDWKVGGYCQIEPTAPYTVKRRYLDGSLVLETTFRTEEAEVQLVDCFTMTRGGEHEPYRQILRTLIGIEGNMEIGLAMVARFDYGAIKPWIRKVTDTCYCAIGGSDGLVLTGDFPMKMRHRHDIEGKCRIEAGQRVRLSITYRRPEEIDDEPADQISPGELDGRLEETIDWWRSWSVQGTYAGVEKEKVFRSAVVLKGLTNAPTGAIAAAPTTSLPEAAGGVRNWDYRFSWVRDSCFTVRALAELGFDREADGFRRFVERTAAGSADQLRILFGIGGERRLYEHELEHLEGYRGASPVRIGNAAETQVQLDVYGLLLDLAYNWHRRGQAPDDDYWEFLASLVNHVFSCWKKPDRGIWEIRGKSRHFVQSKVMCWAALNYGIRLAEELDRDAPLEKWRRARDEVRQAVERDGYDSRRGVFIQAFGHPVLDSSLLLLPLVDFVAFDDERMIRTTNAIREDLMEDGLLRRYAPDGDGLEGREGVFLPCTFWLVECLAGQGRSEEARAAFDRALTTGNDLGLFPEEYDTETGELLGNFPQGLTHLSLITAAVALADGKKS